MAYNFLNKTTYTDDLAQQENILNQLISSIDNSDYSNIDPDLIEIISEELISDFSSEEEAPEDNTMNDEFFTEPDDKADMELLNMLFDDEEEPKASPRRISTPTPSLEEDEEPEPIRRPTSTGRTIPRIWDPEEEPSKYQFGGGTLYANDPQTQNVGLNNSNYSTAVMNLTGTNTIRGLDNYQPVAVTDGSKYRVLMGPEDIDTFNGPVYEKRLKRK